MTEQPKPTTKYPEMPITLMVIQDLTKRAEKGLDTYGTLLTADNGRDHLLDAYHEALDLCLYLRAEIERREVEALKDALARAEEVATQLDFLLSLFPTDGEHG
jgi:hypothetical protein